MRVVELAIAPGAPTKPRAAAEHNDTKAVRATYFIDLYLIDFFTKRSIGCELRSLEEFLANF